MKYTLGDRDNPAVSYERAKRHLRLDDDSLRAEVLDLVEAAADFVEGETEATIGTREIEAVLYLADLRCSDGTFSLPRGPVVSVESVTDAESRDVTFTIERIGNDDRLRLTSTNTLPVTVVYTAGHDPLPGALRQCVLHHVAESYVNRGTVGTFADGGLQPWIKRTLDHYRRTPAAL